MAGETVLVIDDSDELRSLLESVLPYGGYKTISAATGREGLGLVSEANPDVILVDLELPDTSGLKLLEELNRRECTIPAVMMTGYGSEGVAARALRLGVRGYLIKPFTTEEVLTSIKQALSVSQLHREKERLAALVDGHLRHLRILFALGRFLTSDLDLDPLLRRIVEAGLFISRAEASFLSLLDEASEQLQVVASHGQAPHARQRFSRLAGSERLQPVLQKGVAVRLCATSERAIELQTGGAVKAVLQAPLKAQDRVLGLLSVDRRVRNVPFDQRDELMLEILADYAVLALKAKNKR